MVKRFFLLLVTALLAVTTKAQTAVTLPADATIEDDWLATFTMHSSSGEEPVSETMKVAFFEDEVYFNLPNPIAGNTWVKGTLVNGVATFSAGQYLGNYQGAVYMVGQDTNGLCDVVFTYDETKKGFVLGDMQIVLSARTTSIEAWAYYTGMTVVKGGAVVDEQWNCSYTMHYKTAAGDQTESGTESIGVIINGNEVSFNFPNPLNGNAWIKGTIDGSVVTFPKGQQMGTYAGEPFYLVGLNESGLCDVVFNYDSAKGVFNLGDMYLLINASIDSHDAWCYFSKVTISKGSTVIDDEDPVVVPDGLFTQDYLFKGTSIVYNNEGNFDHNESVQWPIKVGFIGSEVYIRGLCQFLPMAWAKGDVADGYATFPKGQLLGKSPMSVYLCGLQYGEMSDVIFELENQNLKGKSYIYINSAKNTLAPYAIYAGVNISRMTPKAATPTVPTIEHYQQYLPEEGYAALMLTIPTSDVDGNVIAPSCLGYRLFTEKNGQVDIYTFTKDKYIDLPDEEMTVIPYDLFTGYNFYTGGSMVYINDNLEMNDRLGVQSVYTVGKDERVSEIAWVKIFNPDDVSPTQRSIRVESVTFTDLQGRKASPSTHGLLIKTERLSDGTVRSTKVLR